MGVGHIQSVWLTISFVRNQSRSAGELQDQLQKGSFIGLRPFGKALTHSLREARTQPDGIAIWEEEDYCSPPLAEERAAVLDKYFDEISVEPVEAGEGWKRIEALPRLNRDG
jgi:hypothetical protein